MLLKERQKARGKKIEVTRRRGKKRWQLLDKLRRRGDNIIWWSTHYITLSSRTHSLWKKLWACSNVDGAIKNLQILTLDTRRLTNGTAFCSHCWKLFMEQEVYVPYGLEVQGCRWPTNQFQQNIVLPWIPPDIRAVFKSYVITLNTTQATCL